PTNTNETQPMKVIPRNMAASGEVPSSELSKRAIAVEAK
ncbi:MAG: hypothetical protein ACI8XX_002537, partial [Polaribacter sp.]